MAKTTDTHLHTFAHTYNHIRIPQTHFHRGVGTYAFMWFQYSVVAVLCYDRPGGLVVWCLPSESKTWDLNPLKSGTLVAALPGAWCYSVSAGTGCPVSVFLLSLSLGFCPFTAGCSSSIVF